MDQPTPPTDQLPPRLRWFAPWRWRLSRRETWGLVGVVLIGYVLSPGIIQYVADRLHFSRTRYISDQVTLLLYPPRTLAKTCPYLATIHREEWMWMCDLLGAPTPPLPRQLNKRREYRYILRREDGVRSGNGNSFREQRNGKLTALTTEGHLIVNDKAYGRVPDGASIIVEKDGRVLINGAEKQPE
jgi:hypothetical protein